jgi:outer membrane receptor protein involved in Fe transport
VSFSSRDFLQKSLAFESGIPAPEDPWTAYGDPNTYFTPENLQYTTTVNNNGATNYTFPRRFQTQQFGDYAYQGTQDIIAGYFRLEQEITPWVRILGGLRPENTDLSIDSTSNRGNTNSAIQQLDVLPSAGLLFTVMSNMNVRLSYSETVARPTYREFAPYESYDPFGDEIVRESQPQDERDPEFDVRWEWFPIRARCCR